MKKIVVFDIDGTLLDTIETIAHYINATLSHFGFANIPLEAFPHYLGNGPIVLMESALAHVGYAQEVPFDDVFAHYNAAYEAESAYKTVMYPGIDPMLKAIKARNIRIGAFSNKQESVVIPVMSAVFGEGYFDGIRGMRPNFPRKPDPRGLFELLDELELSIEDCLYVGDTEVDYETGTRANVDTVLVDWGFRTAEELRALNPPILIHKPEELLQYLD